MLPKPSLSFCVVSVIAALSMVGKVLGAADPTQLGCSLDPLVQCPVGYCCSKHGFCGKDENFCKTDCGFQCDGHPEASNLPASQVGTYIHHCNIPGTVAMTFDDGPHTLTEQLLDTLKANGLHVTFFVIGNTLENPTSASLLKRAYDEGHHIASHTYDHIDTALTIVPESTVRADLAKTEEAIYNIIGKRVRYFRPPQGSSSPEQLKLMAELGYQVVFWNMDTNDWLHRDSQEVKNIYAKNLINMDPKKHQILSLHHDIHNASIIAAPDVIKMVEDACFKIVTVPECLGDKQWYQDESEHPGHQVPSIEANCVPKYPVLSNDAADINTTSSASISSSSSSPTESVSSSNSANSAIEQKSSAPVVIPSLILGAIAGILTSF